MHVVIRAAVVLVGLPACTEGRLRTQPLPELVAEAPPAPAATVAKLLVVPDETLIWNIHWRGFTVARAELVVKGNEVHSRLRTGMLASSVASIDHELTTVFADGWTHPVTARDTLEIDGKTTAIDAAFEGTRYSIVAPAAHHDVPGDARPHTVHSALGWMRAWAGPDAGAGYLYILHAGELVRADIAQPMLTELQGTPTFRIDCRVRANSGKGDPFAITIWLAANDTRTPLRFEIASAEGRITAELIDA